MKSLRSIALVGLVAGALFSCNKSNNNTPNANSTDEAADLVTASVSLNSQGSFSSFNDVTVSAETKINVDSLCGTVWADSVKRSVSATPGGASYSYNGKYSYALNCTNGVFNNSATITSSYSGSFSNPTLASTFSGSSNFTVAGLGKTFSVYTINGQYNRSGSFQSKTDTTYSGTETIAITLNNIAITKPLLTVKSGTANFTISGNMPKRGAFNFTGNIVFNGGYNATLTINGTVYAINLATGVKTKM